MKGKNGVLIPQTIFVGDTAQFLFILPDSEWAALKQKGITPNMPISLQVITKTDSMTIQDIRVLLQEATPVLRITFIPWETGTIQFPALSVLDMHNILPAITVSSILKKTGYTVLQPPKQPLLMPGTDYLLYGIALLTIVSMTVTGVALFFTAKTAKRTYPHMPTKKRVKTLLKTVRELQKQANKLCKAAEQHKNRTHKIHSTATSIQAAQSMPLPPVPHMQPRRGQQQRKIPQIIHLQIPLLHRQLCKLLSFYRKPLAYNDIKAVCSIKSWYAALDKAVRLYLYSLATGYADAYGSKEHLYQKMFFFSATYTQLADMLEQLFPHEGVAQGFSAVFEHLEFERFGAKVYEQYRTFGGTAQIMLKRLPLAVKKAETVWAFRVAEALRIKKAGNANLLYGTAETNIAEKTTAPDETLYPTVQGSLL